MTRNVSGIASFGAYWELRLWGAAKVLYEMAIIEVDKDTSF